MEKERSEKVRRLVFLDAELYQLRHLRVGHEYKNDINSLIEEDEVEVRRLIFELYPDPPKDLFEDIKKRQEKMKDMKDMKRSSWQVANVKKGFLARIFCR